MDRLFNQLRWQALWPALGAIQTNTQLFGELAQRYQEPWRAYHTVSHIEESLTQFDAICSYCHQPAEVEMAIWFHDAIYDTHRADNEERSAAWALAELAEADVALPVRQRIYSLILATRHDQPPQTVDETLLVDLDLAIFGQTARRFDEYEAQIRQEYHWVTEPQFCQRRAAILRRFLARDRIYRNDYFFTRLEQPARANLSRSLARLTAQVLVGQ